MRIYLVGYMCSGKSKVGLALSKAMRYKFFDTDLEIEEEAGKSIQKIFTENGEDYFRKLEAKILHTTTSLSKVVIATGGGLPCFHDNMTWMNEKGITVYLEAKEGLLFHRLASSRQERPLIDHLNDVELMERISRDLILRNPIYQLARIKVNAANINLNVLKQKLKKLK